MSRNWYAVQVGDDYTSDYVSTVKREALRMSRQEARKPENDGLEIRIAVSMIIAVTRSLSTMGAAAKNLYPFKRGQPQRLTPIFYSLPASSFSARSCRR